MCKKKVIQKCNRSKELPFVVFRSEVGPFSSMYKRGSWDTLSPFEKELNEKDGNCNGILKHLLVASLFLFLY